MWKKLNYLIFPIAFLLCIIAPFSAFADDADAELVIDDTIITSNDDEYDDIDNDDTADDYAFCVAHSIVKDICPADCYGIDGSVEEYCEKCYKTFSCVDIYAPEKIVLKSKVYTFDGKEKKPAVVVYDRKGNKIESKYYNVSYTDNKNPGAAKLKIKFKGLYEGSLTEKFVINPKGSTLSGVTSAVGGFKASWKKQSSQCSGYQLQYSTSNKFSSAKTITVSGNSKTSTSVSKLKNGKKYYVRLRTYKSVDGKKYYSGWSSAKSITTKKPAAKKSTASSSVKTTSSKSKSTASSKSNSTTTSKSNSTFASNSYTVYVTPTGSCYHSNSHCGRGTYSPTSYSNAVSMGLRPCQKCF